MTRRWQLAPAQAPLQARLVRELRLSALLSQCLINRGLAEPGAARAFLEPRLRQLQDPALIPNLPRAVDRLWQAHERSEAVVIFGDYDVDGVSATALLLEVLRPLGWQVHPYLPHRLDEGYGLTRDAVDNCLQQRPATLLLAVDCGSTAGDTIAWLRAHGVDTVVLDHHQVADPPPAPVALVNPQLGPAGPAGFRELCSAGLAFKLAHGVVKRGREVGWPTAAKLDLRRQLDLAALGTVADLVPIVGENRILAAGGLTQLNRLARPGIRALKAAAQINGAIGAYEVGFQLGPRLNAAGRLENAMEALELLLAQDDVRARALAEALEQRNQDRQNLERAMAEQVITGLRQRFRPQEDYVIVEGQLDWHLGVVGIVASRVLGEFYRPTLILGGDGHEWRGSGRSIEGFDLAAALRECSDLLVRHGGHAMAAGVTLDPKNLPALRTRLNALAKRMLKPEQLHPPLRLDAAVTLAELTLGTVAELGRLEPIGQGNPPVHTLVRSVSLRRPPVLMGRERQHVKLWITDQERTCGAVWWHGADKPWPEGRFDLACVPQINEYDGSRSVQLKVLDWRPATATPTRGAG